MYSSIALEPSCVLDKIYHCPCCGEEAKLTRYYEIQCDLCEIFSEIPEPDCDWNGGEYVC